MMTSDWQGGRGFVIRARQSEVTEQCLASEIGILQNFILGLGKMTVFLKTSLLIKDNLIAVFKLAENKMSVSFILRKD